MSAFSITNSAPSERRLTGKILFLLAGLAALGALATNIILPAFPRIGVSHIRSARTSATIGGGTFSSSALISLHDEA